MSYPTSPDGEATPTDPGAIDWKEKTAQYSSMCVRNSEQIDTLEGENEALRERIKIIKGNLESEAFFWKERTEAAEAYMATLAGALDELLDSVVAHNEANDRIMIDPHATEAAMAILAATPEAAIERARAMRAEGYAAGLEAAAKWHDRQVAELSVNFEVTIATHKVSAKAIRALGKEES